MKYSLPHRTLCAVILIHICCAHPSPLEPSPPLEPMPIVPAAEEMDEGDPVTRVARQDDQFVAPDSEYRQEREDSMQDLMFNDLIDMNLNVDESENNLVNLVDTRATKNDTIPFEENCIKDGAKCEENSGCCSGFCSWTRGFTCYTVAPSP